jgi:hypothetical protein
VPLCDKEVDPNNDIIVSWRRFEKVRAGFTKKGEPKFAIRLEYRETSSRQFLAYAVPKVREFILHNWVYNWQERQYKNSLNSLKEGEILSLIDFAENYSFKGQNEIQSEHWFNWQLTILVHIMYAVNPYYDKDNLKSKRFNTSYFYYISDDKVHDNLFVQCYLAHHWRYLNANRMFPARHVVWSDGCSAQFKGGRSWFHVGRYPSLTVVPELPEGCTMEWNYWGTGHGKGPHDGAGACLKQLLRKEQLKTNGHKLQCAKDVVEFLNSSLAPSTTWEGLAKKDIHRVFREIGENEVDRVKRVYNCKTIAGSRAMHSVRSISHDKPLSIQCRNYSCFCTSCMSTGPGSCPNSSHVEPWRLVTVEPCSVKDVASDSEEVNPDWEIDSGMNTLAAELEIGDCFAILAEPGNSEKANWFILQCTKPMHLVQEEVKEDAWGNQFDQGDEVVEGLYFQQKGIKENSYIFLRDKGTACVYSHHVCANKFAMVQAQHKQKGNVSVYQLSDTKVAQLKAIVRSRQDMGELEDSSDSSGGSDDELEDSEDSMDEDDEVDST